VLILSPHALDRCIQNPETDWVAREINIALTMNKRIVPVLWDFTWPRKEDLPENIRDVVRHNGVPFDHFFFESAVEKICTFLA